MNPSLGPPGRSSRTQRGGAWPGNALFGAAVAELATTTRPTDSVAPQGVDMARHA